MEFAVIIGGIVLGAGCGAALGWALGRQSMAAGLGAVIVSFLAISAALFAVRELARELLVPFGTLTVLAFLAMVVAAGIRRRG